MDTLMQKFAYRDTIVWYPLYDRDWQATLY